MVCDMERFQNVMTCRYRNTFSTFGFNLGGTVATTSTLHSKLAAEKRGPWRVLPEALHLRLKDAHHLLRKHVELLGAERRLVVCGYDCRALGDQLHRQISSLSVCVCVAMLCTWSLSNP